MTAPEGRKRILVVEDDESIMELIRFNLVTAGFDVLGVSSGEEALMTISGHSVHLILLDLMLPGTDGFTVCKLLKADVLSRHIPIVIVSAKGEEADVVRGLELGADDYITKPFSPRILIARVKSTFRKQRDGEVDEAAPITAGKLRIHPGRFEISIDDVLVRTTATEFKIIHFLASRRGWVFTRDQIVRSVHGNDYPVTERAVDVVVVGLRKKLGEYGEYIETVRGVGYRFKE